MTAQAIASTPATPQSAMVVGVIATACAYLSIAQRQVTIGLSKFGGLPSCRGVERKKRYLNSTSSSLKKSKISTKPKSLSVREISARAGKTPSQFFTITCYEE